MNCKLDGMIFTCNCGMGYKIKWDSYPPDTFLGLRHYKVEYCIRCGYGISGYKYAKDRSLRYFYIKYKLK